MLYILQHTRCHALTIMHYCSLSQGGVGELFKRVGGAPNQKGNIYLQPFEKK